MWYVLQTMTGKEEELVSMIKNLLHPVLYEECFVAYYERIWRKQGQSIVHIERLFPGYVFIVSDDPEKLFFGLKRVPAMSKLLSGDKFEFISLRQEEEEFFNGLFAQDKIIKLSYVEKDGKGHIYRISGPLEKYTGQIVRYQLKKRYVIIRFQMSGIEKTAALGIFLREDVQQELSYGKVEAPVLVSDSYEIPREEKEAPFMIGDQVKVTAGTLEGMEGVIWKIKKNIVEVGIHLFGQDVSVDVAINNVCIENLI